MVAGRCCILVPIQAMPLWCCILTLLLWFRRPPYLDWERIRWLPSCKALCSTQGREPPKWHVDREGCECRTPSGRHIALLCLLPGHHTLPTLALCRHLQFTSVACQDGYPLEKMCESEVEQAIALHIACSALNAQVASPAMSRN